MIRAVFPPKNASWQACSFDQTVHLMDPTEHGETRARQTWSRVTNTLKSVAGGTLVCLTRERLRDAAKRAQPCLL